MSLLRSSGHFFEQAPGAHAPRLHHAIAPRFTMHSDLLTTGTSARLVWGLTRLGSARLGLIAPHRSENVDDNDHANGVHGVCRVPAVKLTDTLLDPCRKSTRAH